MQKPRGARFGWLVLCMALAVTVCTQARGARSPLLPSEDKLVVLPKGTAVTVGDFTLPGGADPKEGTQVTFKWDDEALDVTFECVDAAIADQSAPERDSGKTWRDDSVEVHMDLGHTHDPLSKPIALKLSVAGGLMDRQGGNMAFDIAGVTSDVERTDDGWRGHIRIPWEGLGWHPEPGDGIGLNLTRIDHEGRTYANMKYESWAPFDENFENLQHWGHAVFAAADAEGGEGTEADWAQFKPAHEKAAENVYPQEDYILVVPKGGKAEVTGLVLLRTGEAPREATVVTVSWDDEALDVTFDCVDDAVTAEHTERDDIKLWKDDSVYVWLDPEHTHNPDGLLTMLQVGASGALHDAADGDMAFNAEGATTDVERTDDGYRAHLRLPWAALGLEAPKPGDVWGVNFCRMDQPGVYDPTTMQSTTWVPNSDAVQIDRWGHMVFAPAGAGPDDAAAKAGLDAIKATHEARRRALDGEE